MKHAITEPTVISYSTTISACEKDADWQTALGLFSAMGHAVFRRISSAVIR